MTYVEKRKAVRQQTNNRARVAFNDGSISVVCAVKDLSTTGARLATDGFFAYPDEIDVRFIDGPELSGVPKRCRVVWRNNDLLGVHFQSA